MRHLIAILALALSACATGPTKVDPNYQAGLDSALAQAREYAAAEKATADASAQRFAACANDTDPTSKTACYGFASVGSAQGGSRAPQPVIPPYTPPPSFGQQALQVLSGLSPLFQVAGNVITQNHAADVNAKTSQVIAGYNAARETAQTNAWAGAVTTIATADASRAPAIQIGAGGVYSAGPVQQVGGDIQSGDRINTTVGGNQAGRDNIDRHDVVTNCYAGGGGQGGGSGDPGGAGASGAGAAGGAGGSACH